MDQVLRDAGGTIQLFTYDSLGQPADVQSSTAPTVVVTDSAGVTAGGFTGVRDAAGSYSATIPANMEVLDTFDVVWTWANGQSRRSQFELVGGFIYTLQDVWNYDPDLDPTTYPAAKVLSARSIVHEVFEGPEVGVSFRPRGNRYVCSGDGTYTLILPDTSVSSLISIKVDGTALSAGDLADLTFTAAGVITRKSSTWHWGIRNIEVLYEYGHRSVPRDIWDAALQYTKSLLVKDFLEGNPRATGLATDVGFIRLTLAGRDGITGLPNVDAVLARYSQNRLIGFIR